MSVPEHRELEAGTRWPDFETYDRICKLFGWPQAFMDSQGRTRSGLPRVWSLGMRLRMVDVAGYFGVKHQRVSQMLAEGKLPAPRHDDLRPLWRATWFGASVRAEQPSVTMHNRRSLAR